MNNKIAAKIAALEATLSNDADVLSVEQRAALNRTLAQLRGNAPIAHDRRSGVCARCGHTFAECASAAACDANLAKSRPTPPVIDVTPIAVEAVPDAATPDPLSRDFVTAGDAFFTFKSATGEHFTFHVERPEKFRGEYFGQVFKGTDNADRRSYKYVGMVNDSTLTLRATNGSKQYGPDSKEFKVLAWALDIVAGRKPLRDGYELRHAEKCGRCGRKLTNPESIRTGIGPECADKLAIAA